jgi:hypothetical protein
MRARCKDGNHHDVVKVFKSHGWAVEDVTAIDCFCDIHVSHSSGLWSWIEIKNGANKKLTRGEIEFRDRCIQNSSPWFRCNSALEVQSIIKSIKEIFNDL